MNRGALDVTWQVVLIGALLLAPGAVRAETFDERYSALIDVDDRAAGQQTTRERGIRVAEAYDRHFGGYAEQDIAKMGTEDLRLYVRATELVLAISLRAEDLKRMESAYGELVRRAESNRASVASMHSAYILSRRFGEARALAKLHDLDDGQAQPIYTSRVPAEHRGPTLLEVSASESMLSRVPFDPPKDGYIVIVSHPMCHFSRRAIAAIEEHAQLREIFSGNVIWLAPVDGRLNFDVVQSWNSSYPQYHVSIAFSRQEWPEIDHWGTPTFYFFGRDGLTGKIVGWPKEGRIAELLGAAQRAGLAGPKIQLPSTENPSTRID